MSDLTPEALDRPFDPENVKRYNFSAGMGAHEYPGGGIVRATDYDALLAAYRTQESENRIAMRALGMLSEELREECLAEARAQEGKPEVQERRDGNIPYLD